MGEIQDPIGVGIHIEKNEEHCGKVEKYTRVHLERIFYSLFLMERAFVSGPFSNSAVNFDQRSRSAVLLEKKGSRFLPIPLKTYSIPYRYQLRLQY